MLLKIEKDRLRDELCVKMFDMQKCGMTTSVIATKLGMTKGQVCGHLFRFRKRNNIGATVRGTRKAAAHDRREPVGCRYITGHVGSKEWYFCQDKTKAPGKSYCHKHHKICHKSAVVSSRPKGEATDLWSGVFWNRS